MSQAVNIENGPASIPTPPPAGTTPKSLAQVGRVQAGRGGLRTAFEEPDTNELERLWGRSHRASVFNHPGWWQAMAQYADRPVLPISVREDGELLGYWPFWIKRLGPREAMARIIEPVGARFTDYVQPLVAAPAIERQVMRSMLVAVRDRLGPLTLCYLPKLAEPEAARGLVEDVFPALQYLSSHMDRPCHYIPLRSNLDETGTVWKAKFAKDLNRQQRRLSKLGHLEFWQPATVGELVERLDVLFSMHRKNWVARGGRSEFEDFVHRDLICRLGVTLPFSMLEYSELRLDGVAISAHFGFIDGDRIMLYKPTFDLGFAAYSPGKVHTLELIRWSIAKGLKLFDFLQGSESYKLNWTSGSTLTQDFVIARRSAYPLWYWNTKIRKHALHYRA